ncbi:hypothetical protein GRZ55_08250 [Chelativorans sp. ZYF759]|nr:hypothetical protein [Chelativorans sp. ZYF759]NMG39230.1 hypothetical protein [Chelativorans sp. ZYF759]
MTRIRKEQPLTFEEKTARPSTAQAIKELQQGRGKRFEKPEALLEDLDI